MHHRRVCSSQQIRSDLLWIDHLYEIEEADLPSSKWRDQEPCPNDPWAKNHKKRNCGNDQNPLLPKRYPAPWNPGSADHSFWRPSDQPARYRQKEGAKTVWNRTTSEHPQVTMTIPKFVYCLWCYLLHCYLTVDVFRVDVYRWHVNIVYLCG